ncbi:MAG: Gfo/Idh/MocA family protein [Syntrophobacteraceae bacterium]
MAHNASVGYLPLRGAIAGFGNVAVNAHLPILQKNGGFLVEAVIETQPERARLARELLPDACVYSTMQELVAHEKTLDFIDICTPPAYHDDLIIEACDSGLHVFCEKPLSTLPDKLLQIRKAAERSDRVVFTVNNWKYAPIWEKTIELMREKRIGAIRSVSIDVLRRPGSGGGLSDWRKCKELAGGGILIDHGWHNLYLTLSIIDEIPLSVVARMQGSEDTGSSVEETVHLEMKFPNSEAQLHLTWLADCRKNFGTIVGEKGALYMNDDHLLLDCSGSPAIRFDFPEAISAGSHHPEWMEPVVEDFCREIRNVQCRGANLSEALQCATIIQAAYRSSRESSCAVHTDFLS